MSTTTIRIDSQLKARIASAAEQSGQTAHAYIVDALAQTVARHEAEEALHRVADKRWARILKTGRTVPLDDAKRYLVARGQGKTPSHPVAREPSTRRRG